MATPRKRRKLIDGPEEAAFVAELAHLQRQTPKVAWHPISALAPPSPALPVQNGSPKTPVSRPSVAATSLNGGKTSQKQADIQTPRRASTDAASTSLLRSALKNGPSSFSDGDKRKADKSNTAIGATPMLAKSRPSAPPDPLLKEPKKPPDRSERPATISVTSRADQFAPVANRRPSSETRSGGAHDQELKPAKLELALLPKVEDVPPPGSKAITMHVPVVDPRSRRETDSFEELSSPRKRKGGGLLLCVETTMNLKGRNIEPTHRNGLAQQAVEVLKRGKTDHALWQHAIARRISTVPVSTTPLSTLRQHVDPDLRLKILSVLPGSLASGSRLIARCAILDDESIPSSAMEEIEEERDIGTVVFSLAMHPTGNARNPPRSVVTEPGQVSLLPINNPAELVSLTTDTEVWVFEPWHSITFEGEADDSSRALCCTRFAAVRAQGVPVQGKDNGA